jgi:hypothetical protein
MTEQSDRAAVLQSITKAIDGLRFGHVHIAVHDGRVVQIEKVERTRLDLPQDPRPGVGGRVASEERR